MKRPFLYCSIYLLSVFGSAFFMRADVEVRGGERTLRIKLEREETSVLSPYWTINFEKDYVNEAIKRYQVKLPAALPEKARIGLGPCWPLFVILKEIPGKSAIELILDSNSNFDLTDDEALTISNGLDKARARMIKRTVPGTSPHSIWLSYLFAYMEESVPGGDVPGNVFMNAGYDYHGEFRVAGRDYSLKVDDNGMNAVFKKDEFPDLNILIQAKNESSEKHHYQRSKELFAIGNDLYSLRGLAEDGSWIEFSKSELRPAFLGRPAPDMSVTDTEGKAFKISDYQGRALLLNFWTTWCKPCLAKFPGVKKTILSLEGKPFAAIGVNLDDGTRAEVARKLIREHGLSWRQVVVTTGWTHPLYQVYGRLPEYPMAFPVYVLIDEHGLVCYATNDFLKMEACLAAHFADDGRDRALFIPLVVQTTQTPPASRAMDFATEKVHSFLKANAVKMPAGQNDQARIGMMPNGTPAFACPSLSPEKVRLTLDVDRDLDLAEEESREIPIVTPGSEAPSEAVKMDFKIGYADGTMRFASFRFFARQTGSGHQTAFPEIRYIGEAALFKGAFYVGQEEYRLEIEDPTADWLFTPEDARCDNILKVWKKIGAEWALIHHGIRHIPIAGLTYSVRRIWEDGNLAILEPE